MVILVGAALSIRSVVKKPIKFVGQVKIRSYRRFPPERMADRIRMGDIVSLVECQEQYDAEEARKLQKKIRRINLSRIFKPNPTNQKWVILKIWQV